AASHFARRASRATALPPRASCAKKSRSNDSIVTVTVVRVGCVRVAVLERRVSMRVAVLAADGWIVAVIVVPVVVAMRVLVLERFVRVQVGVTLSEVQIQRDEEERAGPERREPDRAVAQEPRDQRADERR